MSAKGSTRRYRPQFKLQLCGDIWNGKIGRREARCTYQISANLIQLWLQPYDRGELNAEEAAAATISEYEAQIAALERKAGQLTRRPQRRLIHRQRPLGLSIQRGCRMIQLPRSTYHYRARTQAPNYKQIVERIEVIQDALSSYGSTHHPCATSARLWCQPRADIYALTTG